MRGNKIIGRVPQYDGVAYDACQRNIGVCRFKDRRQIRPEPAVSILFGQKIAGGPVQYVFNLLCLRILEEREHDGGRHIHAAFIVPGGSPSSVLVLSGQQIAHGRIDRGLIRRAYRSKGFGGRCTAMGIFSGNVLHDMADRLKRRTRPLYMCTFALFNAEFERFF